MKQPAAAFSPSLASRWNAFWFTPADPVNLGVIRILTGFVLVWTHLATWPDLLDFIGPEGLLDERATGELAALPFDTTDPAAGRLRSGDQSVWFHVKSPSTIPIVHGVFVAAMICSTLGLFSRPASILAWIGHLSYVQRGGVISFGLDSILSFLTFYQMFGPSGAALSIDRLLRARRGRPDPGPSAAANVVLRLIQLHLCLVYLSSGLTKLQGATWWNGSAVYEALLMTDVARFDLGRLGGNEWAWILASHAGGAFTLLLEIGFPFLVWRARWRTPMLFFAMTFQLAIAVILWLGSFQAAMFAATVAFVPPHSLRRILQFPAGCRRQAPGSAGGDP